MLGPPDPRAKELIQTLRMQGIRDERVLAAMARTPRERFVPPELEPRAYENVALPVAAGQTISQPLIVAMMTEALELSGVEKVLEIGTGTGYQTAILAQLADEVVTIERLGELAASARNVLRELRLANVRFVDGDGTLGWPDLAPYDGMIVTAAAPRVPQSLVAQLEIDGRCVIPVGSKTSQTLQVITRGADGLSMNDLGACRFVKLIGAEGWPDEDLA